MMKEEEEDEESLEEMRRRILDVRKGPRDTTSVSWIQVVRKMKEEKKEWVVLPSLAWLNQVIFKLKMIREKEEENLKRQWDSLPGLALLNIYCKSHLLDRLQSIPLVCKSWNAVSDDPRCWSSMIPDSVSPEDASIKGGRRYNLLFYGISRLFKEGNEVEEEVEEVGVGLSRLRTLIKKSGGGAAITSLYLRPFICWSFTINRRDRILSLNQAFQLIANCCPNLKHISFTRNCSVNPYFVEALLQLFSRCKKLELVDFSDSYPRYNEAKLMQELGKCLPNLRGIRIKSSDPGTTAVLIATYLPQLKLLSFRSYLSGEHLSNILFSCLELQYLYVKGGWALEYYDKDIFEQGSAQIPEFYCDIRRYYDDGYSDCYLDYNPNDQSDDKWKLDRQELNKGTLDCFEDHNSNETDYFCIDDYCDILKQRKEDQYVSILKEKMKRKKMYWCSSSLKQKKKKTKKYQCAYADYGIQ